MKNAQSDHRGDVIENGENEQNQISTVSICRQHQGLCIAYPRHGNIIPVKNNIQVNMVSADREIVELHFLQEKPFSELLYQKATVIDLTEQISGTVGTQK